MKAWARVGFLLSTWLLVLGVILQTLLAGFAVFGERVYWGVHSALGLVVGPLLGFIFLGLTFASRLPRRMHRLGVTLGVLAITQAALVYPGRHFGLAVQALHPVNALVLFWLGLHVATNARAYAPAPFGREAGGSNASDDAST